MHEGATRHTVRSRARDQRMRSRRAQANGNLLCLGRCSCREFMSCALRSMPFPIVRMSLTFDVVGIFTERSSPCR